MLAAANPYAKSSETAQGDWSEHMYAEPPSQAEGVLASVKGLSFLSQVVMGAETDALPGHEQEPLQQSQ
jgi:hypothetical protein